MGKHQSRILSKTNTADKSSSKQKQKENRRNKTQKIEQITTERRKQQHNK